MALAQLKLSAVKKPTTASPAVLRRLKLVKRLDEQIGLATAQADGTQFSATKLRTVIDAETGLKRSVSVPKLVKAWYFASENGKVYLHVKYGSRVMELAKGKPTVEIANIKDIVSTLKLIRQAVLDGELDAQIEYASSDLREGFQP